MNKIILIFGPPGSGKGTLSGFVAKQSELTHLSVGEMIREHIAAQDEIGKQAEDLVNQGKLISDDLTNQMVQHRLEKNPKESFLLDGYPRDLLQARFLTGFASIAGIIDVTLRDNIIVERLLKRGRADDNEQTIKDRIKLYHSTTEPVLSFLKEKNIPLLEVDGDYDMDAEVDAVVSRITDWLKTVA
ncbi:MAG: nucleoside monophosphate kinase [Nanoarchaeota archaeon]|nr:nucleoside monophosphate kinase [Nanoarchaeota archaeon]